MILSKSFLKIYFTSLMEPNENVSSKFYLTALLFMIALSIFFGIFSLSFIT